MSLSRRLLLFLACFLGGVVTLGYGYRRWPPAASGEFMVGGDPVDQVLAVADFCVGAVLFVLAVALGLRRGIGGPVLGLDRGTLTGPAPIVFGIIVVLSGMGAVFSALLMIGAMRAWVLSPVSAPILPRILSDTPFRAPPLFLRARGLRRMEA